MDDSTDRNYDSTIGFDRIISGCDCGLDHECRAGNRVMQSGKEDMLI